MLYGYHRQRSTRFKHRESVTVDDSRRQRVPSCRRSAAERSFCRLNRLNACLSNRFSTHLDDAVWMDLCLVCRLVLPHNAVKRAQYISSKVSGIWPRLGATVRYVLAGAGSLQVASICLAIGVDPNVRASTAGVKITRFIRTTLQCADAVSYQIMYLHRTQEHVKTGWFVTSPTP